MSSSAGRKRKTLTRTPVTKGASGELTADLRRSGVLPTADKGRAVPPRGGTAPKRKA